MNPSLKYRFVASTHWPVILILLFVGLIASEGLGQRSRKARDPFAEKIRVELKIALDEAEETGDFSLAFQQVYKLFDQVIAYAPERNADLFRETALAVRLLEFVHDSGDADAFRFLRANPKLQAELLFLWRRGENQTPERIIDCLNQLRATHEGSLEKYANLAAAICVVHDQPVKQYVGLLELTAGDPSDLFTFFSRAENRMPFGIRSMPAELLTFVVDNIAPVNEMVWALDKYQGHRKVGGLFFDIRYDYDHLRRGTQKKCVTAGFSLMSIQRHGGVCAEQAYFASAVGKSIGVPAVYTRGRSGKSGHAWVGFLETKGRRAWWNFDTGRYDAYKGIRGVVIDPQTRQKIPASYVAVLAELIGSDLEDRHAAAAFLDASYRLDGWQGQAPEPFVESLPKNYLKRPRSNRVDDRLDLIQAGLKKCPGYVPGWQAVANAAGAGEMSYKQKQYWADVLSRLCGSKYPDFSVDILRPMIESEEDVRSQIRLWERAWTQFNSRADIAAEIRFAQGEVLEKANDLRMAEKCYLDVVNRAVNAGPFAIQALQKLETMYRNAGRPDAIVNLYGDAWKKAEKPEMIAAIYYQQSNWFQIGMRYAEALAAVGRGSESANVQRQLGL